MSVVPVERPAVPVRSVGANRAPTAALAPWGSGVFRSAAARDGRAALEDPHGGPGPVPAAIGPQDPPALQDEGHLAGPGAWALAPCASPGSNAQGGHAAARPAVGHPIDPDRPVGVLDGAPGAVGAVARPSGQGLGVGDIPSGALVEGARGAPDPRQRRALSPRPSPAGRR